MPGEDKVEKRNTVVIDVTKQQSMRVPVDPMSGKKTKVIKVKYDTTRLGKIEYADPSAEAHNKIYGMSEKQLAGVQQMLYEAGFYDSNDVVMYGRRRPSDVAAMARAMEEANARGETWEAASNFRIQMNMLNQTLGGSSSAGGGSGRSGGGASPAGSLQITGAKAAKDILKAKYKQYAGVTNLTDAEFTKAYDKLVKAQTEAPIKYGKQKIRGKYYTVQINDGVNAEDFFTEYVLNKINFGSEDIGGIASDNVTMAKEIAKMYGVSLSTAEVSSLAKGLTDQSMTADNVRKKMVERAKIKYKALANDISETVGVQDLASDYISKMANVLELDASQIKLSDVDSALTGDSLMNLSEFERSLKNDERYKYTNEARGNAASFATNLAAIFGFGAV